MITNKLPKAPPSQSSKYYKVFGKTTWEQLSSAFFSIGRGRFPTVSPLTAVDDELYTLYNQLKSHSDEGVKVE